MTRRQLTKRVHYWLVSHAGLCPGSEQSAHQVWPTLSSLQLPGTRCQGLRWSEQQGSQRKEPPYRRGYKEPGFAPFPNCPIKQMLDCQKEEDVFQL